MMSHEGLVCLLCSLTLGFAVAAAATTTARSGSASCDTGCCSKEQGGTWPSASRMFDVLQRAGLPKMVTLVSMLRTPTMHRGISLYFL